MSERSYPEKPITGVGAVVIRNGAVLLIKRGKPPLTGRWSLPGGRVRVGEDLVTALKREVREECSLEIDVFDLVTIYEYIETDEGGAVRYHYIVFDFRAACRSGALSASSDALDACWVTLEELPSYDLMDASRQAIEDGMKFR